MESPLSAHHSGLGNDGTVPMTSGRFGMCSMNVFTGVWNHGSPASMMANAEDAHRAIVDMLGLTLPGLLGVCWRESGTSVASSSVRSTLQQYQPFFLESPARPILVTNFLAFGQYGGADHGRCRPATWQLHRTLTSSRGLAPEDQNTEWSLI